MLTLAIIASPLKAQNLSADVTLNALMKSNSGSNALVEEYNGRKTDITNAGSADFKASATGANTYLDLAGYDIGSGEGSWDLNLNAGGFGVKASESNMVHRQPWIKTGMIVNSTWSVNGNVSPQTGATLLAPALSGISRDISGRSFNRTESNTMLSYAFGDYGVHAGLWEEKEQGDIISRNNSKAWVQGIDRDLKMVNLGFDAKIGDGAMAYDYVRGNFSDDSQAIYVSTSSYILGRQLAPAHKMEMRNLSFRSHPVAGYNVNGSLMSRTREGVINGYKMYSYVATLAASHRFGKKLNVTVKGYGRTEQVNENDAWNPIASYSKTGNGTPLTYKPGETSYVDKANFTGEMLANYDFSEKLAFNLGYKLDNNYRRHAGAEVFTSSNTYNDLGYVEANSQWNAIAKQNTINIYTAGVNASLPMNAELGLGFKATRSNAAVFEALLTASEEYSADLYVPVKGNLFFTGSAMVMSGENKKSHHTNSKDNQNSYLAGLDWSDAKYTAGANYAFDQVSNHSDMYYGGWAAQTPTYDTTGTRPYRELGVLYRAANDTIGFHGSAKLSKEYTLAANSSYTRSLGKAPVNIVLTKAGDAGTINDLEPSDIRIVSTGLNLKFSPASNKNLSANLGLRRDQWTDKLDSLNSGWVNSASVAVSSKF